MNTFDIGDIIYLDFDPSKGKEIKKRRPAVVVSKSAFNRSLGFHIVCPITNTKRGFKTYVPLRHAEKVAGEVCVHQIRSVDLGSAMLKELKK